MIRKEKEGEEERRTAKLEPKIQVLVHLFLLLLLVLLLVVFSTHMSLMEPDSLEAVAFAPASIVSDTSSFCETLGALDIIHEII